MKIFTDPGPHHHAATFSLLYAVYCRFRNAHIPYSGFVSQNVLSSVYCS